jgi:hypothetical protein
VALAARSFIAWNSLGWAIIIATSPAKKSGVFSVCVLVNADVGTDLSRTYMS